CGKMSGRDGDKAAAAGLSPRSFATGPGAPERVSFEEARLVLSCRVLHAQDLDPACFVDPGINAHYAAKDWHRLYIGVVEGAWKREE
ncbi:MAG: flavoredoxin, partial [Spirochaetaceae bacterium]|nr:flavoredoxin [Spirochaetaceae bacterium]